MARGKFEYWLTEDGLTLLEGWARDGLTDEQLAEKMKIGTRTLYDWKEKYPQILQALKKGKEIVDYEVENALLDKALAGDTTAQIHNGAPFRQELLSEVLPRWKTMYMKL